MSIGNIAESGMSATMTDMEVVSNNIANANTYGFKRSYVSFADIYPAGYNNVPGMGVAVVGINQNFAGGGPSPAESPSFMSINDPSKFFMVKDPSSGQTTYTRDGEFNLQPDGYFTFGNSNQRLQGFSASNGVILGGNTVSDLQIDFTPVPATPTTSVDITSMNLNANTAINTAPFDDTDPNTFRNNAKLFDSLGKEHTLSTFYQKTADNTWEVNVEVDGTLIGTGSATFTTSGQLSATTGLTGLSFTPGNGAAPQTFDISLTGSTQFSNDNSNGTTTQNGTNAGTVSGYGIDKNGIVTLQYTNGKSQQVGQVALATFQSLNGLENVGNSSWAATSLSGDPMISQSYSSNGILPQTLERSNVDLEASMVDLINLQHNFQANAQVEQTFSSIMQTITQL